jgi:prevent-host-death family protein
MKSIIVSRTIATGTAKQWQLQEAKNRLSQVVDQALHNGPQTITLRGKPAAVVISVDEFRVLTAPKTPLSSFFRQSPLNGVELELERSQDLPRNLDL